MIIELLIISFLLFVLELFYFKVADRFNIIDKPNHRSSHTQITLRGGGVIFPIAFLLFISVFMYKFYSFGNTSAILSPSTYFFFGIGLFAISVISFVDDMIDLPSKVRLFFHFVAVTLLLFFIGAFSNLPIWSIPMVYIITIGILNAYNFMDGINGMTGLYSLVILGSLWYINQFLVLFIDSDFIVYPIIANLIFLFFNFRKKAKTFMGDVGSMAIAFWVMALLGLLMMKTHNLKWILFLTIYGTEVVLTIIERLKLKENIFQAHRRHLYQLLSNEKKIDHRLVSLAYALLQLIINFLVIKISNFDILSYLVLIIPTISVYLFLKLSIKKNIQN